MGVYKKETKWVNENVQIALTALGKKIGLSLNVMSYNVSSSDGYHMNIDNKAGTAKNNYFINDELYSREDFWERIEMEWYMGELLGGHSL